MPDKFYIGMIIEVLIFVIIILLAIPYSLLILCNRRFHHRNNMFILNICLNFIVDSIYYICFHLLLDPDPFRLTDPSVCLFFYYMFLTTGIGGPFSCVTFSVHRLCLLRYHTKPFFKSKLWVGICIACQWIVVYILGLPFLFRQKTACINEIWMKIYTLLATVIIPTTIIIIGNLLIFVHVRASTRRVHQQPIGGFSDSNTNNNQYGKLGRRDRCLLQQMILMFCVLIMGGIPVYSSVIIIEFIQIDFFVVTMTAIISELGIVFILVNLFIQNHGLKQYLHNKLREIFRQSQ